jgi:hypothetical protein
MLTTYCALHGSNQDDVNSAIAAHDSVELEMQRKWAKYFGGELNV